MKYKEKYEQAKKIELKLKKRYIDAEKALEDNGFEVISRWNNDNIYKRNNKFFALDHPVWNIKKNSINLIEK